MKKKEYIRKYGEAAYEKMQQQKRDWCSTHPEALAEHGRVWRETNPEEAKAWSYKHSRKGGKYYEQDRKRGMNGIPHEKRLVRGKHNRYWTPFKRIIAPESQIHHEWVLGTADYQGVALVEADQHMHGFIDVIQILEGEITLLAEAG